MDSTGARLNVGLLFNIEDDNEESKFLRKIGFGSGILEHLLNQQSFQIPQAFSLEDLFPKKKRFFIYKGSDIRPPCNQAVWFLAYDTLKISSKQANDFPAGLIYESRPTQKKTQDIYINFNPDIDEEKEKINQEEGSEFDREQSSEGAARTFIILGDDTVYDPFIFAKVQVSEKIITNDNFIVIAKANSNTTTDQDTQKGSKPGQLIVDDEFVEDLINNIVVSDTNKANSPRDSNNEQAEKSREV